MSTRDRSSSSVRRRSTKIGESKTTEIIKDFQCNLLPVTYRVHEFRKFGEVIPPASVHHLRFGKYRLDNPFNVVRNTMNVVIGANPWRYSVIANKLYTLMMKNYRINKRTRIADARKICL